MVCFKPSSRVLGICVSEATWLHRDEDTTTITSVSSSCAIHVYASSFYRAASHVGHFDTLRADVHLCVIALATIRLRIAHGRLVETNIIVSLQQLL